MSENRTRILQMLAEGKIKVDEAERLLAALENAEKTEETEGRVSAEDTGAKKKPKFLHVKVQSKPGGGRAHDNVDIKIPLMLLKAGVKLGSIMPDKAKGAFVSKLNAKGLNINLKDLDSDSIDTLIQALTETSIEVDEEHETVRIYCA